MTRSDNITGFLTGQFIMAMPDMRDPRFEKSVIYICQHNETGAMGLIINRFLPDFDHEQLLQFQGLERAQDVAPIMLHLGGPVEINRGFVLHSQDYNGNDTIELDHNLHMTTTYDILSEVFAGRGPAEYLIMLGYAGWGPGQLEEEMRYNVWLSAPADPLLIFDADLDTKWHKALKSIGVDIALLSSTSGQA